MKELITISTILSGLPNLGIRKGDALLVHSSLSSFGHVQGGAQAIIESLIELVGPTGTLMMPAMSAGRFDPSEWRNPTAPEEIWNHIRFETPMYHPRKTPTVGTGLVSELFRTWPGVRRSEHQHSSFAAWGRHRNHLLHLHRLDDRMGESSPLARFYDLDGSILFLGTGFKTNSCFHLAEYRRNNPPRRVYKAVVMKDGRRELIEYNDVDTDSSVFEEIGQAFEAEHAVRKTTIGQASCRLFSVRDAVDFATAWLNRGQSRSR